MDFPGAFNLAKAYPYINVVRNPVDKPINSIKIVFLRYLKNGTNVTAYLKFINSNPLNFNNAGEDIIGRNEFINV